MKPRLSWIARVAEICRAGRHLDLAQGALRLDLFDQAVPEETFPTLERHYTGPQGLPELQESVLGYLSDEGIDVTPLECVVCTGGTGALACILLATLRVGERVLLPSPFWDYHRDLVVALGMEPVHVELTEGFTELPAEINAAWIEAHRIRAVVAVTPSNPTGRSLGSTSVVRLLEIHAATGTVLIADEVYRDLIFPDGRQATFYSALGRPRLFALHSASKSLGVTGWRIGFVLCGKVDAPEVIRINGLLSACAPTPLQLMTASRWNSARALGAEAAAVVQHNVDVAVPALNHRDIETLLPNAAPFMLIRDRTGRLGSVALFESLLERGIATVPSIDFFPPRSDVPWVRMCMSRPPALVEQLVDLLR